MMRLRTALRAMAALPLLASSLSAMAAEVRVGPGESIQAAIDKAAEGDTVTIAEGVFPERITINKRVALQGAGWRKTVLKPESRAGRTPEQKLAFVDRLEAAAGDPRRQMLIIQDFLGAPAPPTVAVTSAEGVTIRGLRIQGPAPANVESLTGDALVHFKDARAKLSDCAVIGPYMNGVTVTDGSDVDVRNTLIAAIWNVGVAVHPGGEARDPGKPAKLTLVESDVRNCYHRCVTIGCEGVVIDRCRISGSAWHGVRYDNTSPTITSSHLFANARCGVYASGRTAATIRNNVFYRNEMSAISCWFANADAIEHNTIIENQREGIAVLGGESRPTLTRNVFVAQPVAVLSSHVGGREQAGAGEPALVRNIFWNNEKDFARANDPQPLPDGNTTADPKLASAEKDFTPAADSPLRASKAGANDPIPFASPWPLQPEELLIIPDGETRHFAKWKKPQSDVRRE